MLVGEAPGYHEARISVPFVGRAGQLLHEELTSLQVVPGELYVTNSVKHRPPKNRTPKSYEQAACRHYLNVEIELVQPKRIVALGKAAAYALGAMADVELPSYGLRGKHFILENIPVDITWHPAYILRNPEHRPELRADLEASLTQARKQ